MPRRALQILTGVLIGLAVVALMLVFVPPPTGEIQWDGASAPPAPYRAPELELSDPDGNRVNLDSFRGRTAIVFFGYTNCPDVCPATLLNLSGMLDRLTERDAARIQVLFVSLDPERDTPERMRSWLAHFHSSIIGVTGAREDVWEQAMRWGVHAAFTPTAATDENPHAHHQHDPGDEGLPDGLDRIVTVDAPGAYAVEHSTRSFVVDPEGRIVLLLAPFQNAESMARDVRRVLR